MVQILISDHHVLGTWVSCTLSFSFCQRFQLFSFLAHFGFFSLILDLEKKWEKLSFYWRYWRSENFVFNFCCSGLHFSELFPCQPKIVTWSLQNVLEFYYRLWQRKETQWEKVNQVGFSENVSNPRLVIGCHLLIFKIIESYNYA